ncbi:MAG TPA: SDR family NAD(P)-dependent oxidoreductase [Candidatus Acidoferrales bacterium]|nr:SDR family NAD(P)-dependent oxidoreductase [Candidatus Acidoferrales bacterium]
MSAPHSVFQPRLLAGQTALITGASSGINLGIAKRFAEHGANVIVVARNDSRGLGCSVDVHHDAVPATQIERAVAHFGLLDILIAGATGTFSPPTQTPRACPSLALRPSMNSPTSHCFWSRRSPAAGRPDHRAQ